MKCSKCGSITNKFPRMGTRCQPCVNQSGYEQKKIKFAEIRNLIIESKSVPCKDCGQRFPTYCMDFDHLPGYKKIFNISKYQRQNKSLQQVINEITKCEVVCANCHRIRTFTR